MLEAMTDVFMVTGERAVTSSFNVGVKPDCWDREDDLDFSTNRPLTDIFRFL